MAKLTTALFIERSQLIHGSIYDYSVTQYTGSLAKVHIKCRSHGIFIQRAHDHMTGRGCPHCVHIKRSQDYTMNDTVWKARCVERHNNFFSYESAVYTGNRSHVIVTCPNHGHFHIRAADHITGRGCPECSRHKQTTRKIKTFQQFVDDAIMSHGKVYDYSKVNYTDSRVKIEIVCKRHGSFFQEANSHVQGAGCPRCRNRISKPAFEWIQSLSNPDIVIEYPIPNTRKFADGYDPVTYTIYLFHGDYWHGNPEKFKTLNNVQLKNIERDKNKKIYLNDNNINFLFIWETDINKGNEALKKIILDFIENMQ